MKNKKNILVECHDIDGNIQKIPAEKLYFRPSVYGVLVEDGKVLLSTQWDGFDFPGGGIEKHETITDALKREFWEETGLKVEPIGLAVCETSFFLMPHDRGATNCQLMYYAVKKVGGKISTENFDVYEKEYAKAAQWVSIGELKKVKFYNSVDSVRIIQQVANGNIAPL